MNKKNILLYSICSLLLPCAAFASMTISEKKRSFEQKEEGLNGEINDQLAFVNEDLWENRRYLEVLHTKARQLFRSGASDAAYFQLLQEINSVKSNIQKIENHWREESALFVPNESYALWHQPDATLLQLIMDYGAQDYVYLVPPEIGMIRVSISSSLPIPRESWENMLELILAQNGVGVRQLNPYLRELYLVKQDPSGLKYITNRAKDLDVLSGYDRICYILSPQGPDPRSILQFLQKFSNPVTTSFQMVGGEIFIVSNVETIKELLKLYDFIKTGQSQQEYQLVTLTKVDAKEMCAILNSAFHNELGSEDKSYDEASSIRIFALSHLSQSILIYGSKEEVAKAAQMVKDIESQIEDPKEKTVFWYTVKHSDAEELAKVLARVYDLLLKNPEKGSLSTSEIVKKASESQENPQNEESHLLVQTKFIEPLSGKTSHKTADGQNNFIVDPKTGSIIMVVEQEALPKIKDLLRKLDVPKKMVQIEVLLFEKKITNQNNFGLNLLKIGSAAKNAAEIGLKWAPTPGAGILEFLLSRERGSGIPAYDLAYNFLLSQEDVQINASPSITTMNQTPATIAIVEEISINTGADVEASSKSNIRDSYSRAQYGITIQITPTINNGEIDENGLAFVTLDTDITFDTTQKNANNRPDVTRRHIKNHVRIADGQTVILGGLRRKSSQESRDSLPFLGEIPGIGKLFSSTGTSDSNTEMFVFLTPKIICDPIDDIERIKYEELSKRPGDLPELIQEVLEAKNLEKKRLFDGSLTALFGKQEASSSTREKLKEYEGR